MTMSSRVAILGDGQMALVLADALVERGAEVLLWGPFEKDIDSLRETRTSARLPGFELPAPVALTADDAAALAGADVALNAIPAQFIRPVWERVSGGAPRDFAVVCVSKGIENETLMRPTEIIEQVLVAEGGSTPKTCALAGPTIATELVQRLPATMVAASEDEALVDRVQDLFSVEWLRIYRHDDPIGVELAGAMKNVIAIAAGMVDGLGVGDNAKSALLARGLAEIVRLGEAMGARLETFFGVAGVGDLATTCFSPCGRNRTCGERIGKGESLDEIIASTASVIEGVATTKSVVQLAARHGVELPITAAVHAILFEGLSPRQAIRGLMAREQKAERIG
jgi:glycerol-3-phosphate dehydrogenase (NAD(P)+)